MSYLHLRSGFSFLVGVICRLVMRIFADLPPGRKVCVLYAWAQDSGVSFVKTVSLVE